MLPGSINLVQSSIWYERTGSRNIFDSGTVGTGSRSLEPAFQISQRL
ncbi:hypothetical protein CCACVL1_27848 [Corchorus capsularis]|uniref:Uncharacterized protein n=1 Tax=Corchorus capsularis TaxID=210143 RepID=A0A1R3G8M8_COCAP|nr:hypothetical protein CCACVL1_27848 [Corchorus capsularis]